MNKIPTWFYPSERILEQCELDRERKHTECDYDIEE